MLPRVTGIKLFTIIVLQVTPSAPKNIPNGMKNMFATLCSNPMVTKAIIGNQIPKILPMISSDALANHTARHTSQLQPIALINATSNDIPTLPVATLIAPAWIAGSEVMIPPINARTYATNNAPTKLNNQLNTQFLARPPTEAVPSNTPMVMNITLPVNNSEPASTTIIKPTGNTAPNTNLDKPIGSPAATIPALATSANKPPNAMYAPAKKESKITLTIFAEFFAPAVAEIALSLFL